MSLEHKTTYLSPEEKKDTEFVVFITGAAGYMGAMLAYEWSQRTDVSKIIALDKEPIPDLLKGNPKIHYIKGNTVDNFWEEEVRSFEPDVVVHTAWQIRTPYSKKERYRHWRWNIVGSQHIFEYALEMPSVKRLIHFSSVAPYGAFNSNTLEHFFTESESLRKTDYTYAEQKRVAEEVLKEELSYARADGNKTSVYVVRPVAITGPRGRKMRIRFGLQSALSGDLDKSSFFERIVSWLVTWVPATPKWARQYVHEDDVADIVTTLAFGYSYVGDFEIFNLCPGGPYVSSKDMAEAVGKKILPIPPFLVCFVFFLFWHISFGKIPTSPGSWRWYAYPILVDGSKVTRLFGYQYKYRSLEAFKELRGRFETFIRPLITPAKK